MNQAPANLVGESLLPVRFRIAAWLTGVYVFFIHFGAATRFSAEESAFGVTTAIAILIIILGFRGFTVEVTREPLFKLFVFIYACALFSAFSSPFGFAYSIKNLIRNVGFSMLGVVLAQMPLRKRSIEFILTCSITGLFVASTLTLLDFQGVVDVPICNDVVKRSRIEEGDGIRRVDRASGFFPRRSAMAAVYCVTITAALISAFIRKKITVRLSCLATGCLGLVSIFITHNRSATFGCVLSVLLFILLSKGESLSTRVRWGLAVILLGIAFFWTLLAFFPQHLEVFGHKTSYLFSAQQSGSTFRSDSGRIKLFEYAMKRVVSGGGVFGFGFGNLEMEDGSEYSPHNIITYFVWATGFISFVWLPVVGYYVWELMRRAGPSTAKLIQFSIAAWLLHNFTHESLSTAIAWIFVGLLLNIFSTSRQQNAVLK